MFELEKHHCGLTGRIFHLPVPPSDIQIMLLPWKNQIVRSCQTCKDFAFKMLQVSQMGFVIEEAVLESGLGKRAVLPRYCVEGPLGYTNQVKAF